MLITLLLLVGSCSAFPTQEQEENDGDVSRKILGSSVVTSVSVIMDTGNGTQIIDAVGKPVPKPHGASHVASPINLLNPDRYEFFTFNDNGELVKRLMTLEEIQGIVANGDREDINYNSAPYLPEKKVDDIVNNIHSVLKEEIENRKNASNQKPILDTPNVSNNWNMILPAFFLNNGEDITPDKSQVNLTADTLLVEDETEEATTPKVNQQEKTTQSTKVKDSSFSSSLPASLLTKPISSPAPFSPSPYTVPSPSRATSRVPSTTSGKPSPTISPTASFVTTSSIPSTTYSGPYYRPSSIYSRPSSSSYSRPSSSTTSFTPSYSRPSPSRLPSTTPKVTRPSTTEEVPSSTAFGKLSTEQYIGNIRTTTEKEKDSSEGDFNKEGTKYDSTEEQLKENFNVEEVKVESYLSPVKEDTTADAPTITVAIISDVKYNMSNLDEEAESSIVNILPFPSQSKPGILTEIRTDEPVVDAISSTSSNDHSEALDVLSTTIAPTTQDFTSTETPPITLRFTSPTTVTETSSTPTTTRETSDVPLTTPSTIATPKSTYGQKIITTQKVITMTPAVTSTTIFPTTQEASSTPKRRIPAASISTTKASIRPITYKPVYSFKEEPIVASSKLPLIDQSFSSTTESTKVDDSVQKTRPASTFQIETVESSSETSSELIQASASSGLVQAQIKNTTPILLIVKEKEDVEDYQQEDFKDNSNENKGISDNNTTTPKVESSASTPKREENLTQLLLSSTKIYEINTELSGLDTSEESTQSTTLQTFDGAEGETEYYTTQTSLLESIQQLLSQTITDADEQIINVDANSKLEDMLSTMNERPMQDVQEETATVGSSLLDSFQEVTTTTEGINDENLQLSEAVSSVLSQIYSLNGATTIDDDFTTERDEITTPLTEERTLKSELDTSVELEDEIERVTSTLAIATTMIPTFNDTTEREPNVETNQPSVIKEGIVDKQHGKIPAKYDVSAELELIKQENKLDFESKKNQTLPNESSTIYAIIFKGNNEMKKVEAKKDNDTRVEVLNEERPTTRKPSISTATTATTTTSKPMEIFDETTLASSEKESNTSWTLVSTILPPNTTTKSPITTPATTPSSVKLPQQQLHGFGLEETTSRLDADVYQFVELCNELSFGFWNAVTNGISSVRSVFVSPFAATSLLAMVFLGARGATSGEMNEILKLDDMVTFNPHMIFKNVSESCEATKGSGVAVSVIARELYSDKSKGKLLNFYKERARQFYDGHVEEVSFKEIGDVVRRRTNLIVKKNSNGKIQEYLKDSSITLRPPLAGVSASIFETDCSQASMEGRDGELHFVVLPSIRQRRLVPIPAVVFRSGFVAGYDPLLDATAAALGGHDQVTSTIFVIPGQQGIAAPGDGLTRLERQLSESAFKKGGWARLLRSLIPRPGLELQIPKFMHKSIVNSTVALQRMGLKDLFSFDKADLRGLNGVAHELHLSDVLQLNTFATCGENGIGEDHHSEIYPATSRRPARRSRKLGHYVPDSVFGTQKEVIDEPRDYQRSFDDPLHDPSLLSLPLPLRPRQARLPDSPRLRFDRPFLFFVRHNPTGLILHMGRFNPRLLP